MSGWEGGSTRRWREKVRGPVLDDNQRSNGGRCALAIRGVCTGRASHVHHLRGRAATGDDRRFLAASCRACNLHIGEPAEHPAECQCGYGFKRRAAPQPRRVSRWTSATDPDPAPQLAAEPSHSAPAYLRQPPNRTGQLRATLTVLMGCPGSGKTTWMQGHQAGHILCSTERMRTDPALRGRAAMAAFLRALQGKAERALQAGQDVIMDGCNVRAHERSRWLTLARQHHASTHLVVLHAPMPTLLDVQRTRTHGVPEQRMHTYAADFDRALTRIEHEGWTRITHVRRGGGSEYIEPQPKRVSSW